MLLRKHYNITHSKHLVGEFLPKEYGRHRLVVRSGGKICPKTIFSNKINLPGIKTQANSFLTKKPKQALTYLAFSTNCKFPLFGSRNLWNFAFWQNMLNFTAIPHKNFYNAKWILQNMGQCNLSGDSNINLDQWILENVKRIFWLPGLICAKWFSYNQWFFYRGFRKRNQWNEIEAYDAFTYSCTYTVDL